MHVLVFRHVPFEHPGLIVPLLAHRGIGCAYADLAADPEGPAEWQQARALLFMGGPMSANDPLPFLRRELRIIEEAAGAGKPVLGICLGAQLIARALGARVYPAARKEIGWAPVCWTEAARRDGLLGGLSGPEVLFHWHGETFDLPAGAVRLASSEDCPNQAFRFGTNLYGFQFHLEVTPEMIAEWCAEEANATDLREWGAPIDPRAHAARLAELAGDVFGRWADLLANAGGPSAAGPRGSGRAASRGGMRRTLH